MRIGIVGHPCIDEVFLPNSSKPVRSLGGIFYSYAVMERLMRGSDDRFVPLTFRCEQDRTTLDPFLSQLTHLDSAQGLWPTNALTNRVQLVYPEHGERTEHCPNVLPPLTESELTPELLDSLDGLFVNMISGYDLTIDALETALAGANHPPFVHLDVHALVLGDLSSGEGSHGGGRTVRGVKDWRRWIDCCDSMQLNELEAGWFGDPEIKGPEQVLAYREAHRSKLRYLMVTHAAAGATLYDVKHGDTHHAPVPPTKVVNPTGAGDVFGAAFLHSILRGDEAAIAIRNAVDWASWSTTASTLEEILTSTKK